MTDLERLEQNVLDGARRYLSPSASARLRVQSAFSRGEAWWQPASLRPSWARRVTRSFGAGVTLGLVLGTLVGYGASHVAGVLHARQHFAEVAQREAAANFAGSDSAHAPSPAAPAPARDGAQRAASDPAANAAAAALATNEQEQAQALPAGTHIASGSMAKSSVAKSSEAKRGIERSNSKSIDQRSSLAEELSLLSRARRALNRDQANLALGMVLSLDERFPNGVLMEEREATRILCLCALARTDEARNRAQRFLTLHAASVYAERVRDSCAGAQ
jgi:hypothetical protein